MIGLLWLATFPVAAAEPLKPALNQLVVLDPGVTEDGSPGVRLEADGTVEIPPVVHVHPYYFSGDREYQAQILRGGPTVVVANHPKTNHKLYINVMLPAGAPVIAYNKHSITYVYSDQRIEIHFSNLKPHKTSVKIIRGRGIGRGLRDASGRMRERVSTAKEQSPLARELRSAAEGTGKVVRGAGAVVAKAGSMLIERSRAVAGLIPGVQALQSIADRIPEEQRLEQIRQAGLEQAREQTQFVPTIR